MAGGFSVGGLISGLDSNTLIRQLMQLERQPIIRFQERISRLESQQEAIRDIRTQLLTLRNRFQDFRFSQVFEQFSVDSNDETAMTVQVSGPNPVVGAYDVEVLELASATVATSSAAMGGAIDPDAALNSSGLADEVTGTTFSINGQTFTIDPDTQSLNQILAQITGSAAGVTASYDALTDKVVFTNTAAGDTSIILFGAGDDDSNFLDAIGVTGATQGDDGSVPPKTQVTSTRNLGAVDPNEVLNLAHFSGGGIADSVFRINGVTISVDAANDTLSDVLGAINASDAQVTASYDSTSDTIRIVSDTLGSRTISFEAVSGDFLGKTNLTAATQTAGSDARFTINGGAEQTRNTNNVSDAIGGITLNFLSTNVGDPATVTVSGDDSSIVEDIQEFVTAFNEAMDELHAQIGRDGVLSGDGGLRIIQTTLRMDIFSRVEGLGDFESLISIGITTGDSFDSTGVSHIELDEEVFREALRDDRTNVRDLFSNSSDTGIADKLFDYLDEITKTTGFLNARAKANGSIDSQIRSVNDQIDRLEDRVTRKELYLRRQFTQLEMITARLQQQGSALGSFGYF